MEIKFDSVDLKKKNILIIDDNLEIMTLMKDALEDEGYIVDFLVEGMDKCAVRYIQNTKIDLIILDEAMPGVCGTEILKEIREQYSKEELPVLLMTGSTDTQLISKAVTLGANEYMRKPANIKLMKNRIRNLLLMQHLAKTLSNLVS